MSASANKRKRILEDDDDLFGDDAFAGQDVVDLVDEDENGPPIDIANDSQEKNKNYTKLGAFDCVICMDSVKDLTVTHCGKLCPDSPSTYLTCSLLTWTRSI
jgi:E3 ubiquitin-protein ligase RNF5